MEVFVVLLLGGVILLLLLWFQYQLNYWKRRGVPQNIPLPMVGNVVEFGRTKQIAEIFQEYYNKFKGSGLFAGFHFYMIRSIIVLDNNLVQNILLKDFDYFSDRGLIQNEHNFPLAKNIFFLHSEEWQHRHQKMAEMFAVDNLRAMFHIIAKIGVELATVLAADLKLAESSTESKIIDIMDYSVRFNSDVISSSVFGLDCSSLRDPNTPFVEMTTKYLAGIRHHVAVYGVITSLSDIFRKKMMRSNIALKFFIRLTEKTIHHRRRNNIRTNDFLDLLIQMRESKSAGNNHKPLRWTDEEIVTQALSFLMAGFGSTSAAIGFALYELALHQQIQDKARQEIDDIITLHRGELTYECLHEMRYLHQIIKETLRMSPALPHLIRRANRRYETADPKYFIEKDTLVYIPTLAIHYDAEYYPEPYDFKPERFTPVEIRKRPACTWLPYGEGRRGCMASEFSNMQIAIGLINFLRNFKFSVAAETEIPCKLLKSSVFLVAENGIHLKVEPI